MPGSASPESDDLAVELATLAGASCPGAAIDAGYLAGSRDRLSDVLGELPGGGSMPAAVVVPLLAFGDPQADAAIAQAVAAAEGTCLVTAPLGPHPLLAEALHQRLSEAGLARTARVGRISIVAEAEGVIVGAQGSEESAGAAGMVAVLLASRLTIPVAAASLTDPVSLKEAAEQLRAAGVARVAVAPCVIGPEIPPGTLEAVRAETGALCAQPLGSHPSVGQLIAIRYGTALADPRLTEPLG